MGFDPTGEWSWGGFLAGLATVAIGVALCVATVATAGAATPLVAAAVTSVGATASAAAITTGAVVTVGAATDATVVIDAGITAGTLRAGYSLVIDFNGGENDTVELYERTGRAAESDLSLSFSTGFVADYYGEGDYAGEFVSAGYSCKGYGVEYCQDPWKPFNTGARAMTFTFSSNKLGGASAAYDNFTSIAFWK